MTDDILLSIHWLYTSQIIDGTKTFELRRKEIKVLPDTRLWIYVPLPYKQLRAVAKIRYIETDKPQNIWNRLHTQLGCRKAFFDSYFKGRDKGYAFALGEVQETAPLHFETIRDTLPDWTPPQFYKRIKAGSKEQELFETALAHKNEETAQKTLF